MVEVMKKVSVDYVKNVVIARGFRPGAVVLDVTVDGMMKDLDPTVAVGELKVPGREGEKGLSLKGIWEGLKIYGRRKEIDEKWWKDEKKVGKERDCKSYGRIEGVMIGEKMVSVERGLDIFKDLYKDFVKERFGKVIEGLAKEKKDVILLDYAENDGRRWLDHAEILKELILESENEGLIAA